MNNSIQQKPQELWKVVAASSPGAVFEWFDFFLAITLAGIFGSKFFGAVSDPTLSYVFALLSFAVGFVVRPFGAAFFGRMGDLVGRKRTFMVTMIAMGAATASIGLLPTDATAGLAAPILLILCRIIQGLALGGEYGGAASYVAEHAAPGRRGLATSAIQTTATLGLLMALLVTQACRSFGAQAFDDYLWRLPFLLSTVFLGFFLVIRSKLEESPVFQAMKNDAEESKGPLMETLGKWANLKVVLASLFGATAGQGVVWYAGQFYALIFITKILGLEDASANMLIAASLAIGTPMLVFFGWLSDKIGRKPIVLGGMALAALTYFPLFGALEQAVNPALVAATKASPVVIETNAKGCSFQFDPVGKASFSSPCDVAKKALAGKGVPYTTKEIAGDGATIKFGEASVEAYGLKDPEAKAKGKAFGEQLGAALKKAGYQAKADPTKVDSFGAIAILSVLLMYVAMVYGPIAAWLVELFPARIRYTAMSLPYHIGNGWFGGLLPATAIAMIAATGDIFFGLWFPVGVAAISAVIGLIFLPETVGKDIGHDAPDGPQKDAGDPTPTTFEGEDSRHVSVMIGKTDPDRRY